MVCGAGIDRRNRDGAMSSTDLVASGQSHDVTAVAAAANASPDPALGQATRLIAQAVAMLDRGDPRRALGAASEACHCASHVPQAHYVYGQAWSALGNEAQAERAFAAAIQLAPTWAEAWVNYGVARYRRGAIEDAKTAMRQALQGVEGHPAARANLAAFMRISGETEAAEILLRETVAREPDNAAARLNLAATCCRRSAPARRWRCSKKPSRRSRICACAALASAEIARAAAIGANRRGTRGARSPVIARTDSAGAGALWHWRQVLLALGEADIIRAREAAGRMEAALATMGPEAVPEHRIMAHYDLAKFWSGPERSSARLRELGSRPCAAQAQPAVLARRASRLRRREHRGIRSGAFHETTLRHQ